MTRISRDVRALPGISRREMLLQAGFGFGAWAALDLFTRHASAASDPLAVQAPHAPARAKHVIFLFMQGGPSHIDTFDPKPRLDIDDGKAIEFNVARTRKVQARTV